MDNALSTQVQNLKLKDEIMTAGSIETFVRDSATKINVKPPNQSVVQLSSFNLTYVTQQEFDDLGSQRKEDEFYIITDYILDARGEKVIGVKSGEIETDAANFGQLSSLSIVVDGVSSNSFNKVKYVDHINSLSTTVDELFINEMSLDVYNEKIENGSIRDTELYLINDYVLDGGGNPIKNVGKPEDSLDAARWADIVDLSALLTAYFETRLNELMGGQIATLDEKYDDDATQQ